MSADDFARCGQNFLCCCPCVADARIPQQPTFYGQRLLLITRLVMISIYPVMLLVQWIRTHYAVPITSHFPHVWHFCCSVSKIVTHVRESRIADDPSDQYSPLRTQMLHAIGNTHINDNGPTVGLVISSLSRPKTFECVTWWGYLVTGSAIYVSGAQSMLHT